MTTISLKVPGVLLRDMDAEARRRGVSKSALIRDTLEKSFRRKRGRKHITCLDLMGDMVGSFKGPSDLSTNPKYLEEAILADHSRGSKNSR